MIGPADDCGTGTHDKLQLLVRRVADRTGRTSASKKRICILLGAGADISSGGLTFAELKRRAVERLTGTPLFDITSSEEIERRFEGVFRHLDSDDRALLIDWLFDEMGALAPSDAYKLLVLLAEAGAIDAVITTNFDVMLEAAQGELGRDLFLIYAPGTARPDVRNPGGFDLPKKPYLKLHGDLASRTVLQVTGEELEANSYDPGVQELIASIVGTHDLIIAGYGGYDSALAQILGDAVRQGNTRVFWCAPHPPHRDAPLHRALGGSFVFVKVTFDELISAIARPVLERPSAGTAEPSYLPCLLDWRLDYCNRSYRNLYGEKLGSAIGRTLVRRPAVENRLTKFLQPNAPLAVVTGPSGFGKTTIGLRLERQWNASSFTKLLLLRARTFPESGDLEQHISDQLGGLGSPVGLSIVRLERWLADKGLQLVVYLDGINEFSPELLRCVGFFRGVIRCCYFLPEKNSAIRIVATIRQETWNAMLPHLDLAHLRQVMWSDGAPDSLATIVCSGFTDAELGDALEKLKLGDGGKADFSQLSPSTLAQLRDPYMLRMLAEAGAPGEALVPSATVYQRALEAKLRRSGSTIGDATLEGALSELAMTRLEDAHARFRELDVQPAALRSEIVRVAKDLNILVEADSGYLQFDHDRTFEYFLAVGFGIGNGPPLETVEDLRRFLERFKPASRPYAAARLFCQLHVETTFLLVETALQVFGPGGTDRSVEDKDRLFGFAREVLIQLAEIRDPVARAYLVDAAQAARGGKLEDRQLQTVVQALAALPTEEAVRLLGHIAGGAPNLSGAEAQIYALDKLGKRFLREDAPDVDLLNEAPYSQFFGDASLPVWARIGRVAALASQLGPDNTHPAEYARLRQATERALAELSSAPKPLDAASAILRHFLAGCDRLMFNATPEGIARFFENPRRGEFLPILDRLAGGEILSDADFELLEPYIQSLAFDVEYQLAHALFILSSLNGFDETMALAERRFDRLSNETPPEQIDFLMAVLVYLHIVHGRSYDADRFARWERKVLEEWPDVLLYRPGLQRGERRGFADAFDRFFEDGFGVLFPYGILLPGQRRRMMLYRDYRTAADVAETGFLPLYSDHLQQFLAEGRTDEALQVLQALSSVAMVWPVEGLAALSPVVGHSDMRIQRAVVRILAEAFARHPNETLRFLNGAGVALSDDELMQIKVREDARVGRRQINEEEWARLAHLLLLMPGGRDAFVGCIRDLLTAATLFDAARAIVDRLGLQASR